MPFKNRVRLPVMFIKPQFPVERDVFRLANGQTKVLSMVIRNTFTGNTDQLPQEWHRKLVMALSHDTVTVENERLLSNVVLDGDYSIDWQDFLQYPLAQAEFLVQVTPFDATNSNCQTCEEATQLSLVDDTTTDVWEEGTTNEFPDVLTDNDSICCSPYTIALVMYNTLYFTSVTIDDDGILTATVIDPCPIIDDVWVATYRVTCPDGNYDEADVYANITGSDEDFCYPPLGTATVPLSSTSVQFVLDALHDPIPPGTVWPWELFFTSDLGTVIQSGTMTLPQTVSVIITGLVPGVSYTIITRTDCGGTGNYSTYITREFTITAFAANTCGKFTVTYLPDVDSEPQSISYRDCAGVITTRIFTVAEEVDICMLINDGGTTPIYYVASSVDITLIYSELC